MVPRQRSHPAKPLHWFEPLASAWPRRLEELRATGLLRPVAWLRVVALSAGVALVILAWASATHPGLVIPWRALFAAFVWGPALLVLFIAAVAFMPPFVTLEPGQLLVQVGESARRIDADRIQSIALEEGEGHPTRLVIHYCDRDGRARSLTLGVARRIDRAALTQALASLGGAGTAP